MNVPGFSTNGLLMMHGGVVKALSEDDATLGGEDKPYGVREFPDWRALSDAIESELTVRNVSFVPIAW